jgi:hypothetical protein
LLLLMFVGVRISMLFRMLMVLFVSRLYPASFPPDFDLESSVPHPPCRIFNRSAFSQDGCGACAAFAVSTAFAIRECVRDGRDTIPSPHRLFNCAGGSCLRGSVLWRIVEALNDVGGDDIDDPGEVSAFGKPCTSGRTAVAAVNLASFPVREDDALVLKTELFVFGNPVLGMIHPDEDMALYPFLMRDYEMGEEGGLDAFLVELPNGSWRMASITDPLPVYHITGSPLHSHVVVILGWGSDPEPYWVIQNSWGDRWGKHGRGRLAAHGALFAAVVLDSRVWRYDWVGFLSAVLAAMLFAVLMVGEAGVCDRVRRGAGKTTDDIV